MNTVTISETEYQKLLDQAKQAKALQATLELLYEELRLAQARRFAPSSEKTVPDNQLRIENLFNEVETTCDPSVPEPEIEEVTVVSTRKKRTRKKTLPDNLPIEIIEHEIPEEERVCSCCHSQMVNIGVEVRDRLKVNPAQFIRERHVQTRYACKECEKNARPVKVKEANAGPALIEGGIATPELIAHVLHQKYVLGLPLHRQEKEWQRREINISRQSMANWVIKVTEDFLIPIYAGLKQDLLSRQILHADETTLQVLHEDGKTAQSMSYLWHYRSSGDTDVPIILFDYQPDRRHERPRNFLKGFQGYLHADGYSGYHNLPEGIIVVGCMAHARRKFEEAAKATLPKNGDNSLAKQALKYINKLFSLEKKYKELTAEERYQKRLEEAKPVLEAFYEWLSGLNVSSQSTFGKARIYAFNQRPYLENYLLDGRLELSNNRAENSQRNAVVGRKNFLFCNVARGATATAIVYSLVETAKETKVDPYGYFCWVFHKAMALREVGQLEDLVKCTPHAYRTYLETQDPT